MYWTRVLNALVCFRVSIGTTAECILATISTFHFLIHITYKQNTKAIHTQYIPPQEIHTFQLVEIEICWYIAKYLNIYQNTCQYGGESQEDV